MSTDEKPKQAVLVRLARHPVVRAVARCALMCALRANARHPRSMMHNNKCCT